MLLKPQLLTRISVMKVSKVHGNGWGNIITSWYGQNFLWTPFNTFNAFLCKCHSCIMLKAEITFSFFYCSTVKGNCALWRRCFEKTICSSSITANNSFHSVVVLFISAKTRKLYFQTRMSFITNLACNLIILYLYCSPQIMFWKRVNNLM